MREGVLQGTWTWAAGAAAGSRAAALPCRRYGQVPGHERCLRRTAVLPGREYLPFC